MRYARDLTDEARQGLLEPVVGRAAVLERLAHVLLRRTKNNPLLLGDPGVGKTAVVEALANAIAAGTVRLLRACARRCTHHWPARRMCSPL